MVWFNGVRSPMALKPGPEPVTETMTLCGNYWETEPIMPQRSAIRPRDAFTQAAQALSQSCVPQGRAHNAKGVPR